MPIRPVHAARASTFAEAGPGIVTTLAIDLADQGSHAAPARVEHLESRAQQHVHTRDLGFGEFDALRRHGSVGVLDDESRAVRRLGPGGAEWQEREQPKKADQDGGYRWSVTDLGFSSLNWQDGGSRPPGLSATQLAARRLQSYYTRLGLGRNLGLPEGTAAESRAGQGAAATL